MFARRKRFKRFFEKDEVPLVMVGNKLGTAIDGAAPAAKAPRTPKAKALTTAGASDNGSPKPKSTTKKRKADAVANDESENHAQVTPDPDDVAENATKDESDVEESPKKKVKPAKSAVPKSPATPKSPKEPQTPKAPLPRTSKSTRPTKVKKVTQKDDLEDAEKSNIMEKEKTTVGGPGIQAKTDSIVKENERKTGILVGEPAKQAVHDSIEKAADTAANEE